MTMTLADAARIDDGVVTPRADRPKRRTFTAEYKAQVLAEYDAADRGERGAILRREVRVHLASTSYVLRGRYPWQDWLIRMAFLSGQRAQHRSLTHDARTRDRLGGVGAR